MEIIETNKIKSTDDLINLLSNWNKYPKIEKVNTEYFMYYEDSTFGKIPIRVFIPSTYNNNTKSPAILMLHGAVKVSSFQRAEAYSNGDSSAKTEADDNIFYDHFSKQGFIIIRPFADNSKRFNWVVNQFNTPRDLHLPMEKRINPTFKTLCKIIINLKGSLNIDDSRIFAFGHSDGADGAFMLANSNPNLFAGFILYNSMLTNINATGVFLHSLQNRPIYIVHSDLDDLRSIDQCRAIVDEMKSIGIDVSYKEYNGYKHYDKHLQLDLPSASIFSFKTVRNTFKSSLYWESNNTVDNNCDWVTVTKFDLALPPANWHRPSNVKSFDKIKKIWLSRPYYPEIPSYAIKGEFKENVFTILTSRIIAFDIRINNKMVDLDKNVKVFVNDKLVFNKKILPNKSFIIKSFEENRDRDALWLTNISINNITN